MKSINYGKNYYQIDSSLKHSDFNFMVCSPKGYLFASAKNGGLYRSRQKFVFVEDEKHETDDIIISPNPTSDFIEIIIPYVILNEVKRRNEVETSEANPGIKIYNIYGEEINLTNQHSTTPPFGHPFELEGEAARIDVSALPPGVYFVGVGEKVGKFVKM